MAKVMVHETRRVVLPLDTAVDAVLELDREHGGSIAEGTLVGARIESAPEPGLLIEVRPPRAAQTEQRRFNLATVAAAFINYCWKNRIPLPRHGTKRIAIVPEGIAITIEVSSEVLRRHGALPQQAQQTQQPRPDTRTTAAPDAQVAASA